MIRFSILTVFPELIDQYCSTSILGRAQKQQLVSITSYNLRNWATDKHRTIDDRVFGGGPGMLMKIEPLYKAITELKQKARTDGFLPWTVATAASGNLFTQHTAQQWANSPISTDFIFICGHYEGFDARISHFVDQFVGIGPYVLTGGELPALIMIDATSRLLKGVLGNEHSAQDETQFALEHNKIIIDGEHPQYTMPASFEYTDDTGSHTLTVPDILRSGNHQKIADENRSRRTKTVATTAS